MRLKLFKNQIATVTLVVLPFNINQTTLPPPPLRQSSLLYQFQFQSLLCFDQTEIHQITMSFSTTLSLQFCIRSNRNPTIATDEQPLQFVELRLRSSSKLMSRSSHQILQRTSPSLISDALFPFPLRELEDPPFLSHYLIFRFLSLFHIPPAASNAIFDEIASFALLLAASNLNLNFHIIATVDLVYTHWLDMNLREDSVPAMKGAPASVIERLMKEKYDGNGGEEMGDKCSVCYEEIHGEREVRTRIQCGHVYHQSCIIKWLSINNSCPLCRRELEV